LVARQDLRLDLPNTDMLKTYPLAGWQVVLGEVLTPVAIVTVMLWLMLLAASLTFTPPLVDWWTGGLLAEAVVGIALTLPLVCAIEVLVLNAAVLLFPAWVPQGQRAGGIEVLGQRIFFVAGLLLALLFALLPAAIVAGGSFLVGLWLAGVPAAAAAGFVGAITVLVVEIGLVIAWLGKRFEKFDLSAELRP
jgi:hypothetical protein